MNEKQLIPTYIGKNKGLKFIVPEELFSLNLDQEQKIDRETARKFSRYLKGTFKGFQLARKTKYGNEYNSKIDVPEGFWESFQEKARSMGVDLISFTPVEEDFIFHNLKVFGRNAIILGMEMKWNEIKKAPSIETEIECFRVYQELGDLTIELTEFLKDKGYKSEAHHPFGGKLLIPPLVVSSGLGIIGRMGMVITPEFGPRQRWSLITTDARLPNPAPKDLKGMEEYCLTCGSCIKNCKGGAILEEPIERIKGSGIKTRIDRSKCIKSILNYNYCSVCLKICPQGHPKKKV